MDIKALLNADIKDIKNMWSKPTKPTFDNNKGANKEKPLKESVKVKGGGINQRVLNYTFLVLSVGVAAPFWILVFQPSVSEINKAKQQLLVEKKNYETKLVKISDKTKVENELKLWTEYEDKYKSLLQDTNMSSITTEQGLYTIEKYAHENFLRIDKLQFVENAEPSALTYMLTLGGDYNSIKMFVYDMEQLVQSAVFKQVDMQYKDGEVQVVFKVVFYNK